MHSQVMADTAWKFADLFLFILQFCEKNVNFKFVVPKCSHISSANGDLRWKLFCLLIFSLSVKSSSENEKLLKNTLHSEEIVFNKQSIYVSPLPVYTNLKGCCFCSQPLPIFFLSFIKCNQVIKPWNFFLLVVWPNEIYWFWYGQSFTH